MRAPSSDPAGAHAPYAPAVGERAVYRCATVIDGRGGAPLRETSVVTDGELITTVVSDAELPPGELTGATVVDLRGHYLLPGLIDSHQHLATPPNRGPAEERLRRQLYGGVTAIRDMADDLRQIGDLARATLVGEIAGPDIYYAALMAGPGFFDDPRTWQVSQGTRPGAVPWMQAVDDGTDLVLAVAMGRGTSAVAIKIYADLAGKDVARIVEEAHRQGMQAWAHAMVFPATVDEVVDAGVDVVSHASYLAYHLSTQRPSSYKEHLGLMDSVCEELLSADLRPLDPLLDKMAMRGTILDATASLVLRHGSPEPGSDAADAPGVDGSRARAAAVVEVLRRARAAGVAVSAGTDYELPSEEAFPSLHAELSFLVGEAGMSPAEAIHAATLVGARSAGQSTIMGSVEPGKLANLLVLAGDPLADIANLSSVVFTVKRGRRFERADFAVPDAGCGGTRRGEEPRQP
ncbi:MAG TPA: amidohydrolase family protein [Acidimicrobiales bacterium]|nr:amidohydrolase family protein [Acidimicrobiales bacterium]